MSTQSDSYLDKPHWGGLALGILLNVIDEGTTEKDVRNDKQKHNQLKRVYEILAALRVGKVNGTFVDTPRGLQEKREKAAAENAAAAAEARARKAITNNEK
jgi:hypothetical protein